MAKKKIVVYSCGGTGVNIGKEIIKETKNNKLFAADVMPSAEVQVVMIDTSDSDLRKWPNRENVYLFKDMDGSGSDRTLNAEEIEASIPDIANKFRPGDYSIVIHSAGGGSGSVIGPFLTEHLLKSNSTVIVITVINDDTLTRLRNSVRVLRSLDGIAIVAERVLPVMLHAADKTTENNINRTIINDVQTLALFLSGEIDRLDSADINNFLSFNRLVEGENGAYVLAITTDLKTITDDMHVQSLATISADREPISVPFPLSYHPIGILEDDAGDVKHLHFAILDGIIQDEHKKRSAQLKELERNLGTRKPRISIAGDAPKGKSGVEL